MGALMSLGRPRKSRAAAVAPADADPEAGGATERAKREEEKAVPLTEKQGIAEVPKPRAAAVAPSDPGAEVGAAEGAKREEGKASPLKEEKEPEEVPGEPGAATITSADPDAKAAGAVKRAKSKEGKTPSFGELLVDAEQGKTGQGEVNGEAPRTEVLASSDIQGPPLTTARIEPSNAKTKGPLLTAAKTEAKNAKAKVEHLGLAALKLKSEGVKPMKLTKVEKWASEASDRRMFSEYLKALEVASGMEKGNCHAYVPVPPLHRFRINSCLNVIPSHLSERKQLLKPGINIVMIDGSFAVPSSFGSGNCHIDSMNLILFDIYMSVNSLLDEAQAASILAKPGLEVLPKAAKADLKAAVQELRKSGHDVRSSISGVGGLPLREPTLYWREAFPDVMV